MAFSPSPTAMPAVNGSSAKFTRTKQTSRCHSLSLATLITVIVAKGNLMGARYKQTFTKEIMRKAKFAASESIKAVQEKEGDLPQGKTMAIV